MNEDQLMEAYPDEYAFWESAGMDHDEIIKVLAEIAEEDNQPVHLSPSDSL